MINDTGEIPPCIKASSSNQMASSMSQESEPLLGPPGPPESLRHLLPTRLSQHLRAELDATHGDLILLFCYIVTGLLDSSAVYIWGSFVSMQTGNTVYFGLGLVGTGDDRWVKSGVSITSFCLGSLCFATFHRSFPTRRRWVLCVSFLVQTMCIFLAALIATVFRLARDAPLSWPVLVPLALVAFQSSGQAVTSRVLGFNGLTSVVLTSTYCDLFSHPDFPSPKMLGHTQEAQRLGAVLCLLLGVVLGGLWAHSPVGMMGALWSAAILKSFIIVAWSLWKVKGEEG